MHTAELKIFKGEVENYLCNSQHNFDSKVKELFATLNVKTWLNRANIIKEDGFHASHILFILIILPLLNIKTVHSFCQKHWLIWSTSQKDVFYRFKQNAAYRWRFFMYKINLEIFKMLELNKIPQGERIFVIDDTIVSKSGKKLENVSYIFDHTLGRSVLGYCIVTLGFFTGQGFYPLDFAYRFGQRRNDKSPQEVIGDPRSSSGQKSFEAKKFSKLDLALMMIQRAVDYGLLPGYVLFDSWYAWPVLINKIRKINDSIHVICMLKINNVKYLYMGKYYTLSELYYKVKDHLKKNKRTGLLLTRITVRMLEPLEEVAIVFSKGYREPELDDVKGKKKKKEPKWVAILSTNTQLHAATIIKEYTKRWPVEVCFKECKHLFGLGKDQSNNFNSQVFATTASFLRYSLLTFINTRENYPTLGTLFGHLIDESAIITYGQRLWNFFYGLFQYSLATIFNLFQIKDDFHSYIDVLSGALTDITPFQGCET